MALMATNACIFVSRGVSAELLAQRVAQLVDYYRPLGAVDATVRVVGEATVGVITLEGADGERSRAYADDALLAFGRPPERWRADPRRVLDADDAELARWGEFGALVATDGVRLRLVTSTAESAMLHRADGVYATHAVAAAFLARGTARLDPGGIPELLTLGCVGGTRTLVDGARTVDPGQVIDLLPDERSRSYRPVAQRYAPLPEVEAAEAGQAALAAAAGALRDRTGLRLGLTDGLDSLVVAVVLLAAEVDVSAFTWGEGGFGEPGGAGRARTLGLAHQALGYGLGLGETEGFVRLDAQARWTEGAARLSARGAPGWPTATGSIVTGAGGETGRAFFYRWEAALRRDSSPAALARLLSGGDERVGAAADGWLAEAASTGHTGWRLLDVVYARQRLRRWGRGMLPCAGADLLAPLTAPEVQRALVSLPLVHRLSDGFGRAVVAAHRPDLVPPAPLLPRRGVPPSVRQAAGWVRARRAAPDRAFSAYWAERPRERAWLLEEVLAEPFLVEAMGTRWVGETRAGLEAGEDAALLRATTAAGPVAFARTLRELA